MILCKNQREKQEILKFLGTIKQMELNTQKIYLIFLCFLR